MVKVKTIVAFELSLALTVFLYHGCVSTGKVRPVSLEPVRTEAVASISAETAIPYKKRFVFLMAWNGIPVGAIRAEIPEIIEYAGRKAYVVRLVTESNEFLSKIYRVEDIYTSYVDVEKIYSLRYEADRKEG